MGLGGGGKKKKKKHRLLGAKKNRQLEKEGETPKAELVLKTEKKFQYLWSSKKKAGKKPRWEKEPKKDKGTRARAKSKAAASQPTGRPA